MYDIFLESMHISSIHIFLSLTLSLSLSLFIYIFLCLHLHIYIFYLSFKDPLCDWKSNKSFRGVEGHQLNTHDKSHDYSTLF